MTAYSPTIYSGNGVLVDFIYSWSALHEDHVAAFIGGVETTAFTIPTTGTVRFDSPPAVGTNNISIKRVTPAAPLTTWNDGAVILGADLNQATTQSLYIAEEAATTTAEALVLDGSSTYYDANTKRIKNLLDPVDPQDAMTMGGVTALTSTAVAATAADALATAADRAAVAADLLLTNADTVTTAADTVTTAADVAATAADRVQTGLDVVATAADVLAAAASAATAADAIGLTTKGDLLGFSTDLVRVPVGADGTVVVADAAEPAGFKWGDAASGGGPSLGTNAIIRTNAKNIIEDLTVYDHAATFTSTFASDLISLGTDAGYANEDRVYLLTSAADLPNPLAIDTEYHVVGITATTMQLALTNGGAAITLTDDGSGMHICYQAINGQSIGPVTIETGHSVTVPTGSTWSIT